MTTSELRRTIGETNARLAKALTGGDFAGAAALYTPDGMLLPPDAVPVSGHAAIEGFWRAAVAALGLASARLETLDLETSGDGATAVEVGKATLGVAGGTQVALVNYVVVWRRGGDGVWRLHRDIWNNRPA